MLLPILGFVLDESRKVPAKHFKICHGYFILIYEKPKLLFLFFILCYVIYFSPNEFPGLSRQYGKFWSVSLELFAKHKLWNWEKWGTYYYYYFLLWKFYRCKMVMRYTNFRIWNQFCEEIKSLSKMSWWEERNGKLLKMHQALPFLHF